jgi:hypothetical protein
MGSGTRLAPLNRCWYTTYMMVEEWYLGIAGREIGPLSAHQLKTMAAKGQVLPTDRVRHGDRGVWVAASQVRGLFAPPAEGSGIGVAAGASAAAGAGAAVPLPTVGAAVALPHPQARGGSATATPSTEVPARPLPPTESPGHDETVVPPPVSQPPSLPPQPPVVPQPADDDDLESFIADAELASLPGLLHGGKGAALLHAKHRRQQQTLATSLAMIAIIVLAIIGIFVVTRGKETVEDRGPGGLAGLSQKLEKAAATNTAKQGPQILPPATDSERRDAAAAKKAGGSESKSKPKPESGKSDSAPSKPAGEKASEKPVELQDESKWVDASMVPAVVDRVPVEILSVVRTGTKPGEAVGPHLVITVQVTNPSSVYKLDFAGWSPEAAQRGVVLTDGRGKTYAVQPIDTSALLTRPLPTLISPGESAKDVLGFDLPDPKVKFLRLELSGTAFGKTETAKCKIPAKMITGNVPTADAAAPKPKTAAGPAAKPGSEQKPTGSPAVDFGIPAE